MTLLAGVFLASLLGSVHCGAMCSAFACLANAGARRGAWYHGGRLLAYNTLGASAGVLGAGKGVRRDTELTDLVVRQGSTGALIFTTQTRKIFTPGGLAITEEYDGAFREEVKDGQTSGIPKRDPVPDNLPWRRTHKADAVSLFRFSAITFNPHRIHYDTPYATAVEGYPGLVVHGPYSQHCLIDFVRDHARGRAIKTFHMRARAPLFEHEPFTLVGRPTDDDNACEVWAMTPVGTIAMQATAAFG